MRTSRFLVCIDFSLIKAGIEWHDLLCPGFVVPSVRTSGQAVSVKYRSFSFEGGGIMANEFCDVARAAFLCESEEESLRNDVLGYFEK